MEIIIQKIFQEILKEEVLSIKEIVGFGTVNMVFDVKGKNQNYIIRLNEEEEKKIEYQKEKWCLDKVGKLGIPSPNVLSLGIQHGYNFIIQNKINGINGSTCTLDQKKIIWKTLGNYATKFQQFNRFDNQEIENDNFHKNWKNKLTYNIKELDKNDSLLHKNILTSQEQQKAKEILTTLLDTDFKIGLRHGDLCPRNVIWNDGVVYLIDWGTAEMDIAPHMEIGNVLMNNEASPEEFKYFLTGLGISTFQYQNLEKEINTLNLLDRLDKYRWAEDHQVSIIKEYEEKVRIAFHNVI